MKFLIHNKLWLCLLATLVLLGCKRTVPPVDPVVPVEPTDPNEIVIRAVAPSVSVSSVSSRGTLPDSFSLGHTVGLYTRWKDDSDLTRTLQANCYYLFGDPTWSPKSKADKLMYHTSNYPIYIYGYHPNVRVPGSSTSFASATDSLNIKYSVLRDFSTLDTLRMADFMWSKATGVDAAGNVTESGYVRQGKPVNLPFGHKLCKISFFVKVVDSHPTTTSPSTFTVKKLWIEGEDLNVSATLNVITGAMSYTPSVTTDSLVWKAEGGVTANLNTPVFVTDMVAIPFSVTEGGTRIKVQLTSPDGGEAYFTTIIPKYNGAAYPQAATGNKLRFAQNDFNKINITLDASTQYMQVEATIEPWGNGNSFDFKPDRD